MLKNWAIPSYSSAVSLLLLLISFSLSKSTSNSSKPFFPQSNFTIKPPSPFPKTYRPISSEGPSMNLWNKLGFGSRATEASPESLAIAQGPDDDIPAPGQQFAQFGAGCFWGVELAFQRVPGLTKTEVGYTQGHIHNPTYEDVCSGQSNHSEVVRVQYDPKECSYESLLDAFWARHDPTTLNRQVRWVFFFFLPILVICYISWLSSLCFFWNFYWLTFVWVVPLGIIGVPWLFCQAFIELEFGCSLISHLSSFSLMRIACWFEMVKPHVLYGSGERKNIYLLLKKYNSNEVDKYELR